MSSLLGNQQMSYSILIAIHVTAVNRKTHVTISYLNPQVLYIKGYSFSRAYQSLELVHRVLVKLTITTPMTIRNPPESWFIVGERDSIANEKIAVKNGSIVLIVAVLDTS